MGHHTTKSLYTYTNISVRKTSSSSFVALKQFAAARFFTCTATLQLFRSQKSMLFDELHCHAD